MNDVDESILIEAFDNVMDTRSAPEDDFDDDWDAEMVSAVEAAAKDEGATGKSVSSSI